MRVKVTYRSHKCEIGPNIGGLWEHVLGFTIRWDRAATSRSAREEGDCCRGEVLKGEPEDTGEPFGEEI
jgi:hypothetical protein